MDMVNFDSLAYSKRLAAHGFTTEQADALAEEQANLINSQLATKHDIILVRRDMKEIEASLKRDMKEMEMRLTIRLGGIMATCVAVVVAIVKLI